MAQNRLILGLTGMAFMGAWMLWQKFEPTPASPSIPANTALRPHFLLDNGQTFTGGTAVCVRTQPNANPVMLTALHLFGLSGGLKTIPPDQLDTRVRAVAGTDLSGHKLLAMASGMATQGGYPMTQQGDISGDVIGFRVSPKFKAAVLPLAPNAPIGDHWLWLVGDVAGSKTPKQRLFPARVLIRDRTYTSVEFREDVPLSGFSGAPLVNARGEVAGLLIASRGRTAWIISARLIYKHLMKS